MKKSVKKGLIKPYSLKFNLAMKLTVLLLVVSIFSVQANGYGQKTKVTIDLDHVEMREVLETIESLTDFKFLYNNKKIDAAKLVSIKAVNEPISEVLDNLFDGTSIYYVLRKKQIILKVDPSVIQSILPTDFAISEIEIDFQKTITGTVTDGQGAPLSGANIVEKGTTNGVTADFDGNFSIDVEDEYAVLLVSYIGFATKEVQITGKTSLTVVLEESAAGLDEVVLVGYGTQKKSDLTGAISTVSAADVEGQPIANINEGIQGKIPGVLVSSTSGEPGAPMQVRIRGMGTFGNTGPLYIVDDMQVSVNDVNAIDPSTIESLDVLKDASAAAIYGSRAANGVVLITTKAGKDGKPKLNFESYYGIQSFTNFIPMLNSKQYAELNNDASRNAGVAPEAAFANPDAITVDTDWQEAAYQSAPIQNYTLTISGGNEDAKYSVSGGYFDQQGIMVFSSFRRYSTRVKTQFRIGKRLTIGESLNLSRSLGLNMGQGNNLDFAYLLGASPTMPIYREGNLGGYAGPNSPETGRNNRENIVGRRDLRRNNTAANKILGSVFAEFEIIDDLKYRLNLGINAGLNTNKIYVPTFEMENRSNLIQSLNQGKNESYEYLVENLLTYTKERENITYSLLVGFTQQNAFYSDLSGSIREFPSNELQVIDAGTGSYTVGGNEAEWALRSYLARANVTLLNKYLFTGTFRRDGSSRFGSENKYGNFPSIGLGWNVSRENFMSDISAISNLKIRGSWGQLGNQEIGNYVSQTTMNTTPRYVLGVDQTISPAAAITSLGNPALKWETTTQSDIGIDLNLFKNSLVFSADYWLKQTDGVLLRTPISVATGISRDNGPYENAANIENSGFEFLLSYQNSLDDFNFGLSTNLSTVKNKVTSLGEGTTTIVNLVNNAYNFGTFTRTAVGESMSSFFGYVTDGIFQNSNEVSAHALQPGAAPGDIRFKDINEDGVITDDDRVIIGDPFPNFSYGFSANFSYKNFDANLSFRGEAGKELYNSQRAYLESMDGEHEQMATTLNRWQGEGTSNSMPRAVRGYPNNNARPSNRFVEDASFLKLQTLQIGFNIPSDISKSIGLSRGRIYVNAQNVFTITNYSGYNPDILGGSGWATNDINPLSIGVDTGTYPLPRTIQMGIQVGF